MKPIKTIDIATPNRGAIAKLREAGTWNSVETIYREYEQRKKAKKRRFRDLFLTICILIIALSSCEKPSEILDDFTNNKSPIVAIDTASTSSDSTATNITIVATAAIDTTTRVPVDTTIWVPADTTAIDTVIVIPPVIIEDTASRSFGGEPVVDIDGNIYDVVLIGEQWWMAENLRTTRLNDGTLISNPTDNAAWWAFVSPAYCFYNNDTSYKDYGALYNWWAISSDKICPVGWHVPTDDQWKQLEMFLGMSQASADSLRWRGTDQGTRLKSTSGWSYNGVEGNGTNTTGFNATPAGGRLRDGVFMGMGHSVYLPSVTTVPDRDERFYVRQLYFEWGTIGRGYGEYNMGYSVRCLKD